MLFSLLVTVCAQNVLKTLPLQYNSFLPSLLVESSHEFNGETSVRAELAFNAKVPSVFLDTLPLASVNCDSDIMTLNFENIKIASQAYKDWKTLPEFAMIVGDSWDCHKSEQVLTFMVNTDYLQDFGVKIVLKMIPIPIESVIDDFDLSVGHGDIDISKTKLSKSYGKEINANYDISTKSAIQKEIKLFDEGVNLVTCLDCYGHGEATLQINIKATFGIIKSYQFIFGGSVLSNMDIDSKTDSFTKLIDKELFKYAFATVKLNGVFTLNADFVLGALLQLSAVQTQENSVGFDLNIPFSFEMKSDKLFAKPLFINNSPETVMNYHFPKRPQSIPVIAQASLVPKIGLQLTLFNMPVAARITVSTSLIVDGSVGKGKCDEDQIDIALRNIDSIGFDLTYLKRTQRFDLFQKTFDIKDICIKKL
jgi:hypothetical protein